MVKPDPERVKELIEAFEVVLSYVQRVYILEYTASVNDIARRLLDYVEAEPIEVGANSLPGQDIPKEPTYKCGLCRCEIHRILHRWWDDTGKQHVVCKRCLRMLEKRSVGDWRSDKLMCG